MESLLVVSNFRAENLTAIAISTCTSLNKTEATSSGESIESCRTDGLMQITHS